MDTMLIAEKKNLNDTQHPSKVHKNTQTHITIPYLFVSKWNVKPMVSIIAPQPITFETLH